jgi:hypothetical protein
MLRRVTLPRRDRAIALLRRHRLVAVLLTAGLVLRIMAQVAYQPAIIYVDTLKYLYGQYPGSEPLGYTGVLKVITPLGGLAAVAAVQHLLGLAMGATLYVVLLRRGTARWLAALAAAPVLLDAYELQMEQMIMPDVWLEAMVVAALAVLLWRPAATVRVATAAGVILGLSATVRQVAEIMVVPAVAYLLVAAGDWRRALRTSAALAVAFALPVLCYCSVSYARTGHFWLARPQSTTGRLLAAADCATLKLPPAVRPLCPTPSEQAHGPDWLEKSRDSPIYQPLPRGEKRAKLVAELRSAIERQQPLRVGVSIMRDSLRLFAVVRRHSEFVTPLERWQFQTYYPTFPNWVTLGSGNVIVLGLQHRPFGPFRYVTLPSSLGGKAHVIVPLATFLHYYQLTLGYTPGPFYLLAALAGLCGSVLAVWRRPEGSRERQLAAACLLFTLTAVALLFVPDILEFSWRYELPAVITLPPAGALGVSAVVTRRRERQRPQAQPPNPAEHARA